MRFWVVLLSGLIMASGAMAQVKATPQAQGSDQPSLRQQQLSRRYVELTQTDQLEATLRTLIVGEAQADESLRDMPAEDRTFLVDLATELTIDLLPQMLDRLVPVYARTFSEEELTALVAFYDSDLGRSIADKTIASIPQTDAAIMSVMPQLFNKMAARICARYGCDPTEMRAAMEAGTSGPAAPSGAKP